MENTQKGTADGSLGKRVFLRGRGGQHHGTRRRHQARFGHQDSIGLVVIFDFGQRCFHGWG